MTPLLRAAVASAALAWAPGALAGPDTAPSETDQLRQDLEALRTELAHSKAEVRQLEARVARLSEETPENAQVAVAPDEAAEEAIAVWHDVHVRGHVTGDAVAVGGDVRVHSGGRVDGDAVSIGGQVYVDEGGFVAGDKVAVSMGDAEPLFHEAASDNHGAAGSLAPLAMSADDTMRWLYHRLVWMLTVAGAGIVTVGLFPDRVSRVASDVSSRPVRSAVIGTLATGLSSLFALLFVVLTFGLGSPISLAVFAALGVAWLLGFVGFCQALGDKLPVDSQVHGRWLALGAGVVVLAFAGTLPWVGWFGLVGVSMVGIGASLSTRFGATRA